MARAPLARRLVARLLRAWHLERRWVVQRSAAAGAGSGNGVQAAIFKGTYQETVDLLAAIDHSCACQKDPAGRVVGVCGAHRAMFDQRFLDGLLGARAALKRFKQGEWGADLPYPA